MALKIHPTYKHLTQKKNFCGPACVQMILFRKGIWFDQELLAYKLGVKIDKNDKGLYILQFPKVSGNDSRIGLKITDFKRKKIKNFLRKFNLNSEVYLLSQIKNISKFIIKNIKENNDIMINFWWKPITGRDFGHFVLLTEFDKKQTITVCDPLYKNKSFWKVKLNKLKESMHTKWDGNERGFVVIK